ncbi:MAG: lexA 2 [Massilia sp.]|nr:lexA 2 [Massilia sp.]
MHEQMVRLYEAAEKLKKVERKPSAIARLVNSTTQTVVNWEARGVSADGMIDAEEFIGCSAAWVRSGVGPMCVGSPYIARPQDHLADAMKRSCETAGELQMLLVYRLSNEDSRKQIDIAVEQARRNLVLGGLADDQGK